MRLWQHSTLYFAKRLLCVAFIRRLLNTSTRSLDSRLKMHAQLSESRQTITHLDVGSRRISRTKHADLNQLLRTLQKDSTLRQFEVAQLANLCPGDVEEAKSLIPRYALPVVGGCIHNQLMLSLLPYRTLVLRCSLATRDDDALQVQLNELAALRRFQ